LLLLKTLLLSTSQRNIYRYTTDSKKKKRIVGSTVALVFLYALLMGYCILMCIGYGTYGIIDAAPAMCALTISVIAFVFTFLKTNGYLFNFREYDMLMSLPFETTTVAACKFLYMYVKSLPWYLSISVSMLIGYGCFAHPSAAVYPIWLVLSLFLPVIPMLLAAFLGFLIARISACFRKTNIIQTALTFLFVIFCFSLRFILESMFRNDEVQATLEMTSAATESAMQVYRPALWFSNAVTKTSVLDTLLLIGVSALLFALVFAVVGKSYRNINSALKSHAAAGKYKLAGQRARSTVQAIAFKEFKRLTASTVYMVNGAMGEILAALFGLLALIFGFDKIIAAVTNGAPFDPAILQPAIPFIVYFFIGMMATTVCSPSLEGKNYWIVRSLPIEPKTLYQGKMLFNLYLTVPFSLFSTLCLCLSAHVPVVDSALYLILGVSLCAFSTAWGCVCGVRHMRLDWENEVEVVKQGAAVAIYLFPNMFAVMGLVVGVVLLGMRMDHRLLALLFILLALALAALCYLRAMALAKRVR
jgi:ABC-2 type transport system permease protein